MNHILIVEDHQDVFENIERKLLDKYPNNTISLATNCDNGFAIIKKHKVTNPISLIILDLTFTTSNSNSVLKDGKALMRELKNNNYSVPVLVYSSHDNMEHIHPVISNYSPKGYVIKTHNSSNELLFAIDRILDNETYYSQRVHELQLKRIKYSHKIDEIDEQIIQFLPNANYMEDWENKIQGKNGFIKYKAIKNRIDNLCINLEVKNEKQLLLKLQRLAII